MLVSEASVIEIEAVNVDVGRWPRWFLHGGMLANAKATRRWPSRPVAETTGDVPQN